jgi:type IV pilus assembly protein PilE
MRHVRRSSQTPNGFTLIELMIVVGVATLLLAIALPAYQESTRKARRADGVAGLTRLQLAQEQFRAGNPSYATSLPALPGSQAAFSPERHYGLTIDAASATGYTLTASALAGSPQFKDLKCRGLRVTMAAGNFAYSSVDAGGGVDASNANRCWAR